MKPMRPLALLLASLVACSAGSKPAADVTEGNPFTLRSGQTATFEGTDLTFTGVRDDSRCPQDVQCVWEGDATVVVTSGGAELLLRTAKKEPVTVAGRSLHLVELTPAPRSNSPIDPDAYRATLRLDRP